MLRLIVLFLAFSATLSSQVPPATPPGTAPNGAAAQGAPQQRPGPKPFAEVTKGAEVRTGFFDTYEKDDKLWISFQDDGPGIPEGALGHIFNPFYSTKRPGGGTGMGLSVALGIVRNYGGDIDFQPAPGTGAVFTVTLPLQAAATSPTAAAAAASAHLN